MLKGRPERFFVGRPGFEDTYSRLEVYADAVADCPHAPGIKTRELIQAVVAAVVSKPVNVLRAYGLDGWLSKHPSKRQTSRSTDCLADYTKTEEPLRSYSEFCLGHALSF